MMGEENPTINEIFLFEILLFDYLLVNFQRHQLIRSIKIENSSYLLHFITFHGKKPCIAVSVNISIDHGCLRFKQYNDRIAVLKNIY